MPGNDPGHKPLNQAFARPRKRARRPPRGNCRNSALRALSSDLMIASAIPLGALDRHQGGELPARSSAGRSSPGTPPAMPRAAGRSSAGEPRPRAGAPWRTSLPGRGVPRGRGSYVGRVGRGPVSEFEPGAVETLAQPANRPRLGFGTGRDPGGGVALRGLLGLESQDPLEGSSAWKTSSRALAFTTRTPHLSRSASSAVSILVTTACGRSPNRVQS
jgi:hypothetical protein